MTWFCLYVFLHVDFLLLFLSSNAFSNNEEFGKKRNVLQPIIAKIRFPFAANQVQPRNKSELFPRFKSRFKSFSCQPLVDSFPALFSVILFPALSISDVGLGSGDDTVARAPTNQQCG